MSQFHHHVLFHSPLVSVTEVSCRPNEPGCSGEEQQERSTIVFPRRGVFVRHLGRRRYVADASQVLFFQTGEVQRVSHPVAGGDDCTSLHFAPAALDEALRRWAPGAADRPERPFAEPAAPLSGPAAARLRRLRHALRIGTLDLEAEEMALALLNVALAGAPRPRRRAPPSARHAELAESARLYLAGRFQQRLTLDRVAWAVRSSPYHLARVFRRHAGLPLHQYLNRLRLREALERLDGGEKDLSRLALQTGFSSHSHFTNAFRREFGAPPSELREPSKILQAARRRAS
ncbi:MAG: AraC family transcriptional regulator [Planctomycetota bacterium]|nr:MAG: AraC family transcriptional regulator [Planctomycetota bacterium]